MSQWFCKYCLKSVRAQQKELHQQTNHHKFKARWSKYYTLYDDLIKELDSDQKLFKYSLEEYEAKESEIITELDKMMVTGVFDNQPDDNE